MCFKNILLISCFLSLTACSLITDHPKASADFESEDTNLRCLKTAPGQLQKLFSGSYSKNEADQGEVRAIWSCLDQSLRKFSKYVNGVDPDSYTMQELQSFANRYLPQDQPLNDNFVAGIFKLKSAVVGGSQSRLTKNEIVIVRNKLLDFGRIILPLSPYIGTLISTSPIKSETQHLARISLKTFAEEVSVFFGNSAYPFAWKDINQFVYELESYIGKKEHSFGSGVNALQSITPVLIGSRGDYLTPDNLKQIISKGASLYLTWAMNDTNSIYEEIGKSIDVVTQAPSFYSVSLEELLLGINDVQVFVSKLFPKKVLDWNLYSSYIVNGLKVKSLLFKNSEKTISNFELVQLGSIYSPFRKGDRLDFSLLSAANELNKVSLASVKISDLIPLIDSFLPNGKNLNSFGLSSEIIQDLKVILIGGDAQSIASTEYAEFAKIVSSIYYRIAPELDDQSKKLEAGLNSKTINLFKGALGGLIQYRQDSIPLIQVKNLVSHVLTRMGYQVQDATIETLVIGLYSRMFNFRLTRPTSIDSISINLSDLRPLLATLSELSLDLTDLETAYAGLDLSSQRKGREELLSSLKRPVNLLLAKELQPLINGTDHMIQFPKKGESRSLYYQYDLAYKAFIYEVLLYAFPRYQVEKRELQDHALRLTLGETTDLLTDFNDLIFDLHLSFSDSSAADSAKSRMRSINLFTQKGNGDEYLDLLETTEFLSITLGGKVVLQNIENKLFPICNPGIKDIYQIKSIPYACLTQLFFSEKFITNIYGPVAPKLVAQYLSWSPEEKDSFRRAALTATVPNWTENGMFPISEFETLTSLPYYVENIFERFDADENDSLEFSEIMSGFPVFCREIQKAGGSTLADDRCDGTASAEKTKAIYGYLVFNGKPPEGVKRGAGIRANARAIFAYLKWMRFWKNLNMDSTERDANPPHINRNDLLQIISNLSSSTSTPTSEELQTVAKTPETISSTF